MESEGRRSQKVAGLYYAVRVVVNETAVDPKKKGGPVTAHLFLVLGACPRPEAEDLRPSFYAAGFTGAGLANLASSTRAFGCTSLNSTVICMYVWVTIRLNGTFTPPTSR